MASFALNYATGQERTESIAAKGSRTKAFKMPTVPTYQRVNRMITVARAWQNLAMVARHECVTKLRSSGVRPKNHPKPKLATMPITVLSPRRSSEAGNNRLGITVKKVDDIPTSKHRPNTLLNQLRG